jgi:hypothetical protein
MSDDEVNDYAKLHFSYHEDADLAMIADTLADEHGMGWLVWLYWPRIIAKAKQAQTFGWFSTTPRALAASVHDEFATGGLWAARARMWELFVENDLLRVRQGVIENPSAKVDLLLVEYGKWQSLSNKEKQKLKRERGKAQAGKPVDWVVRHWPEFAFTPISVDTDIPAVDTENTDADTKKGSSDTKKGSSDTTLDETIRNEGKEGPRDRGPLPTSVEETLGLLRDIPGLSRWQIESHVRKAMAQYPSLPDEAVCEAISAFETRIPEGKSVHSAKAWQTIRNCFEVARRRIDEATAQHAAATATPDHSETERRLAAFLADREQVA